MTAGTRWSADEVAQLELMMRRQFALKEIAAQLGRTEEAIATKVYALWRREVGLKLESARSVVLTAHHSSSAEQLARAD